MSLSLGLPDTFRRVDHVLFHHFQIHSQKMETWGNQSLPLFSRFHHCPLFYNNFWSHWTEWRLDYSMTSRCTRRSHLQTQHSLAKVNRNKVQISLLFQGEEGWGINTTNLVSIGRKATITTWISRLRVFQSFWEVEIGGICASRKRSCQPTWSEDRSIS